MVLDSNYTTEANKIAAAGAWIWLLEITTGGSPATLRYTNNNDNVTWNGNVYTKMPFTLDDFSVTTSGAFPEFSLQIGEVDIDGLLYNHIGLTNGLVGKTVRLMVVHSEHLDVSTAAIDEYTEVLGCELINQAVTFQIGQPTLLSRRFPRDRYVPSFCRHKFGGALCKYAQLGNSLASNQVTFIDSSGPADGLYNTIQVADGGLLANLFNNVPGVADAPGNLLTNGSFKNVTVGEPTGWRKGYYVDDWETWVPEAAASREISVVQAKYDGRSVLVQCNAAEGGIYQSIAVTEGEIYTISAWVYVNYTVGASANGVRLMAITRAYTARRFAVYGGWQQLTISLTANSPVLTVALGGWGRAYFDGISVVQGEVAADFTRRALVNHAGFTVSGSASNDGHFLADSYYHVYDTYVRVIRFAEYDMDRTFNNEAAGAAVTLQLGYTDCDHTLPACRIRDNSQNFGGSPGIRGGVYG